MNSSNKQSKYHVFSRHLSEIYLHQTVSLSDIQREYDALAGLVNFKIIPYG